MHQHALKTLGAFALAAACGFAALACAGCAVDDAVSEEAATEAPAADERTMLLPDWYFNQTSDEDVIELLIGAGCTSAERSGDSFAVTMPEAYAEAFVAGMKGEVADIVDELAAEADALGATLAADEEFAAVTITLPSDVYATEDGSNLAENAKAAAAAAYVYRSAADLGPCEAVIMDETGAELDRAALPDDHAALVG